MATRRDAPSPWPPKLARFRASDWPPVPGEVRECCRCSHCAARFGPPKPAGHTVLEAHRRWRRARLSMLVGTPEYAAEALRGLRAAEALRTQNPIQARRN